MCSVWTRDSKGARCPKDFMTELSDAAEGCVHFHGWTAMFINSPEEIGIHLGALDSGKDFTLDDVEHLLPHGSGDLPESYFPILCLCSVWQVGGGRCKPDFEQFLWTFEWP